MSKLVQSGYNPRYPKVLERYWKYSEGEVPEWITDEAKVIGFRSDNTPILGTEETSGGGLIIKSPTGSLVSLKDGRSYVAWAPGFGFIGLTETQKELLYEEI